MACGPHARCRRYDMGPPALRPAGPRRVERPGGNPGHGTVTAILWNTGIPKNNAFGVDIEIRHTYCVTARSSSAGGVAARP